MSGDKNPKTLTGSALERALADNQFERPAMQLVGMVKASEKQNHISFAPAGCETWTDVPSSMIEEAEHLGHQSCKGHSHPIFRLSLQEPKNPTAKVLMGLLAGASQGYRQAPAMSLRGLMGGLPVGLGPRVGNLGSIARKINDKGYDFCAMGCLDLPPSQQGPCNRLCECVWLDGKNVYQCWDEIFNKRASAFER